MELNIKKCNDIAENMAKSVKKDKVEWTKTWVDKDGSFEGFKNALTGETYGVNDTLNLLGQGLKDEYVADALEWMQLGFKVIDGAKIYTTIDKDELIACSEVVHAVTGEPFRIPEVTYPGEDYARTKLDEVLERYCKAEGIKYVEAEGSRSYYSPSEDKIVLPLRKQFTSAAGFYATKAHEFIHSTGAYIRCNREGFDERRFTEFGSMKYSREELVAEIGASFLLVAFGLDTKQTERNALAYCQSWLKELQGNPRWIRKAAELAIEAVECILEYAED